MDYLVNCVAGLKQYFSKMKGGDRRDKHSICWHNALFSSLGGFLGIALIGWLGTTTDLSARDHLFLIGSFGATAVLLFGAPTAPFSQPRNVIGGHVISALVGVTFFMLFPAPVWLTSALAIASAIFIMYLSNTIHPPAGATALIAIIGGDRIHDLGYWYAIEPVLMGVVLMIIVALIMNNLSPMRKYPKYWW